MRRKQEKTEEVEAEEALKQEDKQEKKQAKPLKKRIGFAAVCVALAAALFFGGFFTYSLTLDKEIRSLIWAKNKIQKEYNYEVTDGEFYEAVFDAVDGLLDPYSEYLTEKEYKERLQSATGRWSGVGLRFLTVDECGEEQLLIMRVSGNSPAERAGIQAGNFVIGYGTKKEEIVRDTDYQAFSEFLLKRAEKEEFFLLVKDGKTGEETPFAVCKENFIENYVFYRTNEGGYTFTGAKADTLTQTSENITALLDDTAYIRLTQFNGRAADAFDQAMSLFKQQNKKNLVLDLRGNGGGDMEILKEIAKYFCKTAETTQPTVAKAHYRNGRKQSFRAPANLYYEYFSEDSEICVLADNETASASECLIGCMLDYGAVGFDEVFLCERYGIVSTAEGKQTVYESKTYGKGIMQTTFPRNLWGGEAIKLTTANIVWPLSDTCIHGVGITLESGAKKISYSPNPDEEIESALSSFYAK